jgi:hypothetical protein
VATSVSAALTGCAAAAAAAVASSLSRRASVSCDSSSSTAGGAGGELHAEAVIVNAARAAPPASTRRLLQTGSTGPSAGSLRGTATSCHCCADALDGPAMTLAELAAIPADAGFLAYR